MSGVHHLPWWKDELPAILEQEQAAKRLQDQLKPSAGKLTPADQ